MFVRFPLSDPGCDLGCTSLVYREEEAPTSHLGLSVRVSSQFRVDEKESC